MTTASACIQETLFNPATGDAWSFREGDRLYVDGRPCEFLGLGPNTSLVIRFGDTGEVETATLDTSRMELDAFRTAAPRF